MGYVQLEFVLYANSCKTKTTYTLLLKARSSNDRPVPPVVMVVSQ